MKIYKIIFTVLLIAALSGCDNQQPNYINGTSNNGDASDISYFKDERTGLCFAERGYIDTYTMTCVPCDSVEKLINKKKN